MDDQKDKKPRWFGPKRNGFGIRPNSWQGWVFVATGLVVELSAIGISHSAYQSWFVAKTVGYGFNPATWQGWLATVAPIAIFLLIGWYIYNKQRGD